MPECQARLLNARTVAIPIEDGIAPMLTEAAWIDGRDHPALTRFGVHLEQFALADG